MNADLTHVVFNIKFADDPEIIGLIIEAETNCCKYPNDFVT